MKDQILNVAVVGLGKMGLLHACILNVLPNVRLAALCDKAAFVRKIFKGVFSDIQLIDDVEKLADFALDAVYITTPIPSHFHIINIVYSKGIAKNVFVEKTLASNYGEAQELCKLAGSLEGADMVGYMKRFAVTFGKAKNLLDTDALGNLISFDAYAYSSDFSEPETRKKVSRSRGGVLGDLGSHVVDLALWFFGDFQVSYTELGSMGDRSIDRVSSEDSACFGVRRHDGLEGRFDISWCKREYRTPEFGLAVRGDEGTMTVTDDEVKLDLKVGEPQRWYRHNLDDSVGFLIGAPEYFREDEYFVKSVLHHSNAVPDFLVSSKVDYVIDQVKRRAEIR